MHRCYNTEVRGCILRLFLLIALQDYLQQKGGFVNDDYYITFFQHYYKNISQSSMGSSLGL